jgi:hypothetical protein
MYLSEPEVPNLQTFGPNELLPCVPVNRILKA